MGAWIAQYASQVLGALAFAAALMTTVHILLSRREPGASVAWLGIAWLVPILGSALYLMLGINRVRRRAQSLRLAREGAPHAPLGAASPMGPEGLAAWLGEEDAHLIALGRLLERVVPRPLLPATRIRPLYDGDQAFPAMLAAIEGAQSAVALSTYIFDNDRWGRRFADALGLAVARGVAVRVLIDAAGLRYSFPSILGRLRRARVPVARFMPSIAPHRLATINLRNHRKILVVDGQQAFTGGINLRDAHVLSEHPRFPTRDVQFGLQGPVVGELMEVFAEDWKFAAGEELVGPPWFVAPQMAQGATALARAIADGPDEEPERLRWAMLGALCCARRRVAVVTPYFVPDSTIMAALNAAALRGVQVDIVLPRRNNLPYVAWASMGQIEPALKWGCRVWMAPPPFDHSKLMVVDGIWVLLGSANWDTRSLRLNFEFNLEVWDRSLAAELERRIDEGIALSQPLLWEDWARRSLAVRLRDGAAAILGPYL